jgi:hypothetical protein
MPFMVAISWTEQGMVSRQLYIGNQNVINVADFLTKLTDFIHGYGAMKFNQAKPPQGVEEGQGYITWADNPQAPQQTRTVLIRMNFRTANWQPRVGMTIVVQDIF